MKQHHEHNVSDHAQLHDSAPLLLPFELLFVLFMACGYPSRRLRRDGQQ